MSDTEEDNVTSKSDTLAAVYGAGILCLAGYDEAIIGVVHRCGQEPFIPYDEQKVIAKLMVVIPEEGAIEYFEFNQKGVWVGENTPGFVYLTVVE